MDQSLYSLSGKTSYHKILWWFKARRLDVISIISLWNFTDILEMQLPRCLSNFEVIEKVWIEILRPWDFTRVCIKTSISAPKGHHQMESSLEIRLYRIKSMLFCHVGIVLLLIIIYAAEHSIALFWMNLLYVFPHMSGIQKCIDDGFMGATTTGISAVVKPTDLKSCILNRMTGPSNCSSTQYLNKNIFLDILLTFCIS